MRKYICDHCKKEVSSPELLYEVRVPDMVTKTDYRSKTIDLCNTCRIWIDKVEKDYRVKEFANRLEFYKSLLPEIYQ